MASPQVFDPEAFLTTVGTGRAIAVYKPKDYIFRQGTKCDGVFYIQRGHVELVVLSEEERKGSSGRLALMLSSARAVWQVIRSTSHRHGPPRKPPWPAWRARQ